MEFSKLDWVRYVVGSFVGDEDGIRLNMKVFRNRFVIIVRVINVFKCRK